MIDFILKNKINNNIVCEINNHQLL